MATTKKAGIHKKPVDAAKAAGFWTVQRMADESKLSVETIRTRLVALKAKPVAQLRPRGKQGHPTNCYKADVWRKVRDYQKNAGWEVVML